MKTLGYFLILGGLISMLGAVIYGGYLINRHINWKLGYEDMVKKTIQETVKKECLNN